MSLTSSLFQTVADEKRVVDEQRRTLDEEIADFQRRKVGSLDWHIWICAVFHLHWLKRQYNYVLRHQMAQQGRDTSSSTMHITWLGNISCPVASHV